MIELKATITTVLTVLVWKGIMAICWVAVSAIADTVMADTVMAVVCTNVPTWYTKPGWGVSFCLKYDVHIMVQSSIQQ